MKEPRQWLQQILADQYAMPSTHERACNLYNNLRRQVERRKRRSARMEAMDARIRELESALAHIRDEAHERDQYLYDVACAALERGND